MKNIPALVAGIILGLCFLMASVPVLFNLYSLPSKPPSEWTPATHFFAAFGPTGYVKFVKIFEFVGALVVMVPRLRNFGLLLLGPVIVNIIAFHVLVDGDPLHIVKNWMLDVIIVCAFFLLWDARRKFAGLLN